MSLIYKNYRLTEIEKDHLKFLYSIRNCNDFDNFWFFESRKVKIDQFIDELVLLIKNDVVHDYFVILKENIPIGLILSYDYKAQTSSISLSIYLSKENRNGFNLIIPTFIMINEYSNTLNLLEYCFNAYNKNYLVINFLKRINVFVLKSKDEMFSNYVLMSNEISQVFLKYKFIPTLVSRI